MFFFSSFYVASNTVKYFQKHFPKCKQTLKNKYFHVNHLHLQTFYGGEHFTSKQTEPDLQLKTENKVYHKWKSQSGERERSEKTQNKFYRERKSQSRKRKRSESLS